MRRRSFIRKSGWAALGLGLGSFPCVASNRHKHSQVLIIGAGLAGLHAARLLQRRGIEYHILEGSQRIGGRLFTKKMGTIPTELGGVEIGDGYKRVIQTAKALNIQLIAPPPYAREWLLHFRGKNIRSSNWATTSVNPLEGALKKLPPYRLEGAALRGKIPFENITDWQNPKHHSLDIPYKEFLKSAGYNDQAIQLADLTANHNGIDKVSTLQVMRAIGYRMMGGSKSVVNIEGGSSRLPEAMAKSLDRKVLLNKKVLEVEEGKRSVSVRCQDGQTYTADQLICTLPFSILRNLKLEPQLPAAQQSAIRELEYTKITVAIVACKQKFWEEDGLPISMWTDTPIERVFASNDPQSDEVLLKVFINGKGAAKVDQLSASEAKKLIQHTLHQVRPSSKDKIEVLEIFSWGKNTFSQGAYAEFQAGQVRRFVPQMIQPTKRLFFAGEHTSLAHRGMEGAMASAERAVEELNLS